MKRLRLLLTALFLSASSVVGFSSGGLAAPAAPGVQLSDVQMREVHDIVYGSQERAGFGGMVVSDRKAGIVTLYLAASGDATATSRGLGALQKIGTPADPLVKSGPKRYRIRYSLEGPSLATLDSVIARLQKVEPFSSHLKGVLSGYGIDEENHTVHVGVTSLTPSLAAEGRAAFGNLVTFAVEPVTPFDSGTAQQLNDGPPWFGGTKIFTPDAQQSCTGGFAAYDAATGHFGLLTDGHCVSNVNQLVYQNQWLSSHLLGISAIQSLGNGQVDAAFIDSTAKGVNVDPDIKTALPQGGNVVGTGFTMQQQTMCADGSVTGENCSGVAQWVNQCHNFTSQTGVVTNACGVTLMQGTSLLCQSGDSGGPVYSYPTIFSNYDEYTAYGLIEGSDPGTNNCYYSEIQRDESSLGPNVITGGVHLFTPSNVGNFQGTLPPNQWITGNGTSPNSSTYVYKYELLMQGDGNLVLYSPLRALWASGTSVASSYAIMQGDGNLVIYRQGGIAVWSTRTYGNSGSWLLVQGDGNAVIYKPGSISIWATNTCCSRP